MKNLRILGAVLWMFTANAGTASALSLGIVVGPGPGLNLVGEQGARSWDGRLHFPGSDAPLMSADYRQHFSFSSPAAGGKASTGLGLYVGLGMSGQGGDDEGREAFHFRFPFGVDFRTAQLPLVGFAEVAGRLGKLPHTSFSFQPSVGVRFTF